MPFTVSHVAAVLPVVGRSRRLPAAALVVGSMAPDYPWFLTRGRTAAFSHSLLGVVTVDLLVGVAAVLLWRRWAQAPVRDLVPRWLGERLRAPVATTARDLPWVALAVVVGALTHVLWDSFTHAGRWGVAAVPWLHTEHLGLPGYKWAQFVSGVVGGLVVLVWGLVRLSRTPADPVGLRSSPGQRSGAWAVVAAAAVLGAVLGVVLRRADTLEAALFGAVTLGGAAAALGTVVVCVHWWVVGARLPAAR